MPITDEGSAAVATLKGFRTKSSQRSGSGLLRAVGGKRGCVWSREFDGS